MSGFLSEYSDPNISTGYGGLHECPHTKGNSCYGDLNPGVNRVAQKPAINCFMFVWQVSPLIINTVITILSVVSPAAETPEELVSPVSIALWEKRSWKDLKFWFLEEGGDEDTKSLAPLVPQGESLLVLYCI